MTQYFGLDWFAMCLTFLAIYMLGHKSRNGFLVMMTGNLCWSAIGMWAHSLSGNDYCKHWLLLNERPCFCEMGAGRKRKN